MQTPEDKKRYASLLSDIEQRARDIRQMLYNGGLSEDAFTQGIAEIKNYVFQLGNHGILEFDGISVDTYTRAVYVDGKETHLTRREFDLLAYLMRNRSTLMSTEEISSAIWGKYYDSSAVRIYISHLRKKLNKPDVIASFRGIGGGYRFG